LDKCGNYDAKPSALRDLPTNKSLLFNVPGSQPMIVANGSCATPADLPNDTIPNGAFNGV
jgi:hypothetical protein